MNRFSMERLDYDDYSMVECDDGEFVTYEQHAGSLAAKDARIAKLERALQRINGIIDNPSCYNSDIQKVLDAALTSRPE